MPVEFLLRVERDKDGKDDGLKGLTARLCLAAAAAVPAPVPVLLVVLPVGLVTCCCTLPALLGRSNTGPDAAWEEEAWEKDEDEDEELIEGVMEADGCGGGVTERGAPAVPAAAPPRDRALGKRCS